MSPDVLVVGGGPVGLLTALSLAALGLDALVLEQRSAPSEHSRAIGIHPPSLEILADLGVAGDLVAAGVKVVGGRVTGDRGPLGRLDFSCLPKPFPFSLSVPQGETERILEEHLRHRAPHVLKRGVEVVAFQETSDGVEAVLRGGETLRAPWAVAADGKGSVVRRAMGIPFEGSPYPHAFAMGDFEDGTDFSDDAVLFLTRHGLVESFPLPGGWRRWVCSLTTPLERPAPSDLVGLVATRTGQDLSTLPCRMTSGFGVQRNLARVFHGRRTLLAGDAAHVVSPIGGQGMNLGFWDAAHAALLLAGSKPETGFQDYDRRRRAVASTGARRAERNMLLGLGGWWNPMRDAVVYLALRSPLRPALARVFTMRGLDAASRLPADAGFEGARAQGGKEP